MVGYHSLQQQANNAYYYAQTIITLPDNFALMAVRQSDHSSDII